MYEDSSEVYAGLESQACPMLY